jgi:hypothetical protein
LAGRKIRRLSGGQRIAEYFEVPVEVVFSTERFTRIGSAERSAS